MLIYYESDMVTLFVSQKNELFTCSKFDILGNEFYFVYMYLLIS